MNTYTSTIPADRLPALRRRIIRHGGSIVTSVFCQYGTTFAGGYRVTYVSPVGAL